MTKWIACAAVCLLPLAVAGCKGSGRTNDEPVRPVQTMVVGSIERSAAATYSGQIEAQNVSKQGFQVGGSVAKRSVEVGDHVAAGAPLLQLDLRDLQNQLTQAQAQLDAARDQAAQAKVNLGRSKALVDQKFISEAEYDQSNLNYEQAQSSLQAARAQYDEAKNALGYGTLRAAVAGVVTAINVDVGAVVQPGVAVVDIAADGPREAVLSVPESRVDEIREAHGLTVTLWASPGHAYKAKLRLLKPDTSAKTSTYDAHVTLLDPDARLRLGMTAYVHVPAIARDGHYAVPLTAICHREGATVLWIVNANSTVRAQPVKIASLAGDNALIASGIKRGEVVVTAGAQLLHAGQKVKPVGSYFPHSD